MIAVTGGTVSALAAKAATTTIPIVLPLPKTQSGSVSSPASPGQAGLDVLIFSGELTAKRLEVLHGLPPTATRVAVLVNPAEFSTTETTLRDVEGASRAIGAGNQSPPRQYKRRDQCCFRKSCP